MQLAAATAPAQVAPPVAEVGRTGLEPGFVAIPGRDQMMNVLMGRDRVTKTTQMQADIGYGFNYNGRRIVNLELGRSWMVQPSPVFGDAWKQALEMSNGENPAVAIVREGAELVLRQITQPGRVHAAGADWGGNADTVAFRPADGLQEWNSAIGQRTPRETHGVKFLDSNILGFVDDGVVVKNPNAK